MHKRTAELIEYGRLCGFELGGLDGRGHYEMTHANGEVVRVAATPGEYRGDDNCRAEMRRKSGVTPEVGRRAGKFRKGIGRDEYVPATQRVESVSAQYDRLRRSFDDSCQRVREAQANGDRGAAFNAVMQLMDMENSIAALGRPVPPRAFRLEGVA